MAEGQALVEADEFFAPMSADMIDSLVGQYHHARKKTEAVAGMMNSPDYAGVEHWFVEGNCRDSRYGTPHLVGRLFNLDGALAALNASFWDRALKMTDVLDCMPQKRRDEWYEHIREHKAPEFTEDVVRATLGDLMIGRAKFFAERVDGIFQALSRTHVTNRPEGFSKRMIISGAISSYGTIDSSRAGYINDLRCIIAKFMGRDEPRHGATDAVIRAVRMRNGEWAEIDGGALRMRIYNGVGTAHLEVHPDMAWRLNGILASLYPAAIPASFRTKPKPQLKERKLMARPLPFAVIDLLACMKPALIRHKGTANSRWQDYHTEIKNTLQFGYGECDRFAKTEAERVLEAIGGARVQGYWQFDYHPGEVLEHIVCSGCIPDQKSFQFYPTPEGLARRVVELAEIGSGHVCLEPSAGTGGLADLMPKDRTRCVEVSQLRCDILSAKGFPLVSCDDFLAWAGLPGHHGYDRVAMNPPFSDGRWQDHLEAAASLVKAVGRLVAILPSGARQKVDMPGWSLEWHGPFDNEFAGASVSVLILVAERGAA